MNEQVNRKKDIVSLKCIASSPPLKQKNNVGDVA